MKKVALLIVLILGVVVCYSQTDDTTKYTWYKYQYGSRMDRYISDKMFYIPLVDDTAEKAFRPGALVKLKSDNVVYQWENGKWNQFGGLDITKVPLTRTITINGTTQDLSANRTWTLTKSDLGLGNVDNTSDVNKPVSTAQRAELADTAAAIRTAIAGIITTVDHDNTLTGNGTSGSPLKVDTSKIVTHNALRDSLNNITVLFGNAGDGEPLAFTRNDSLLLKKIKVTNATVSSDDDSTLHITIPPSTLTATQVGYGAGDNTITSEAAFNYTASTNKLHADTLDGKKVSADTTVARGVMIAGAESYNIADTLIRNDDAAVVARNGIANLAIIGNGSGASGYPSIKFRRTRGTLLDPTASTNNDTLWTIEAEARVINGSFTKGFMMGATHGVGAANIVFWRNGASESMRLIEGGKLGIGVTTPVARLCIHNSTGSSAVSTTFSAYQKMVYLSGQNESPDVTFMLHDNSAVRGRHGQVRFYKTSGTSSVPGKVLTNDTLGAVIYGGYDGAAMLETVTIRGMIDSAVSVGSVPTSLVFAAGKASSVERMRIRSNGNIGIGTSTPAFNLDVNGTFGIAKASMPLVNNLSPVNVVVYDTSTGQAKRAKIADVVQETTQEYTATVTTNNATQTTIATIPLSTLTHALVEVTCVGIVADGSASYSGKKHLSFLRNSGGTITTGGGGTSIADSYIGSLSTATHNLTSSGGDILIQVTGEASTTISWKVRYKITQIFTSL